MIDLKPCPFCGERRDLEVEMIDEEVLEMRHTNVICHTCEAEGPGEWVLFKHGVKHAEERAIAFWNGRVENET